MTLLLSINWKWNRPFPQFSYICLMLICKTLLRNVQGMVDPGENVNVTLKREFSEEAMNSLEMPEDKVKQITKQVDDLFRSGTEVSF